LEDVKAYKIGYVGALTFDLILLYFCENNDEGAGLEKEDESVPKVVLNEDGPCVADGRSHKEVVVLYERESLEEGPER
jgi:hypothetical protein